jgi:V/A-type H+-transporting ATPase subunit C
MANSKHSCINTKIMGMKAKMLTDEDYRALIHEPDVAGTLAYLRENTYYAPFLKDVDTNYVHRQAIEIPLNRMRIQQIEKMLHYLSDQEKSFAKLFLMESDIESLRVLMRELAKGESLEDVVSMLVYSQQYTTVQFDRLIKTKDWESFKKELSGTDYYRILEIYKTITVSEDLFPIEKSLERYYYDRLKSYLDKLDGRENKQLITVMRKEIDLLNLIWFYRGKRFYHLSREELMAYSLRGGLHVREADIQQITETRDMEAFFKAVESYEEYRFLFNHRRTIDLHMERRRERFLYFAYLSLFHNDVNGLGRVVSFIRLTEFEIEDVISIIESKRYRMKPTEAEQFLIRYFN